MDSRITVCCIIIVCGYLVQHATPCDEVNLAISTNVTALSGSSMALVDNPTFIKCNFACACNKVYLIWRKEGQAVYSKTWSSNSSVSGPIPAYEDKVARDLIEDDDDEGIYVLQWNNANWTDLPPGQIITTWDCLIRTDTCSSKVAETEVEYRRYPELSVYVGEKHWSKEVCVERNETVMVNCTALAHEGSQLILGHGDDEWPGDCYNYSAYESFCSVSATVTINDEFHCNVIDREFSEERGCDEVFSPQTPDEGLPPWAITLIVLGVAGTTTAAVFGGVYIKKKKNNTR